MLSTASAPTIRWLHAALLVDPNDAEEMAEAERLNEQIVRLALSMDDTCTGEHGVGLHKMDFLGEEAGEDAARVKLVVASFMQPSAVYERIPNAC